MVGLALLKLSNNFELYLNLVIFSLRLFLIFLEKVLILRTELFYLRFNVFILCVIQNFNYLIDLIFVGRSFERRAINKLTLREMITCLILESCKLGILFGFFIERFPLFAGSVILTIISLDVLSSLEFLFSFLCND